MSHDRLEYDRTAILGVLRDLNELVVSLDRIGSAYPRMPDAEWDAALSSFVVEWHVFRKLARARSVLSEPFSTELGPDDMDELEREMKDLRYWSLSSRSGERTVTLQRRRRVVRRRTPGPGGPLLRAIRPPGQP